MTASHDPWSDGPSSNEQRASKVLELAIHREMLVESALLALVKDGDFEEFSAVQKLDLALENGLLHPTAIARLERELAEESAHTPLVLDPFEQPPVKDWQRYELIDFVGRGGMGDVYKARDPRLGRLVAIKFLRRDDPQVLARFVREARIQARVDHEGVCPVYEVGEANGRPYIVMQYVSGGALPEIRERLELKEMVQIIADAAEALHAAHRLDLVHRDVKPANIMVEYTEAGIWRPFVVDFGIAHEMDSSGLTQTGAVLGTPAFAAPEQIRGKTGEIDARSDIYSLGATLYWLVTGKAPFEGAFTEIVRGHTTALSPEAPSRLNPEVSRDLDIIILKCLEMDQERRYLSAFELSEDLRRYLAGEPILARPAGVLYRLRRKARRHPAMTGALATLVAAALALGAFSLYAQWKSARQATAAQALLDRIIGIESLMRVSVMMPAHDSSPERQIVHTRIEEIRREVQKLGPSAKGPGRYALGRAHLVLGETEDAVKDLEAAWDSGFRSPEVAASLGRALGRVLEERLRASRHIAAPELRHQAERRLSEKYRKPALELLQKGGVSDLESTAAVMARIAFYEDRISAALEAAGQAVKKTPWDYASYRLIGDLLVVQATDLAAGGSVDGALDLLRRSQQSYDRALEIARSDADTMMAICHRWLQEMETLERNGRSGDEAFLHAREYSRKARQVAPEEPEPWETSALLFWKRAEQLNDRGNDPDQDLKTAISAARKAIDLDPASSKARHVLGGALTLAASRQFLHGDPPDSILEEAVESLEKAVGLEASDPVIADDLGYAHDRRARYLMDVGKDPEKDITQALEAYEAAIRLSPDSPNAYNNSGIAWWRRALWQDEEGHGADSSLNHAEDFFRRALKLNPRYTFALANLGMVYRLRGSLALKAGADPSAPIAESLELFDQAVRINPSLAYAWSEKAKAALLQLKWEKKDGRYGALALAEAAAGKALDLDPERVDAHLLLSELHAEHADILFRTGRSGAREISKGLVEAGKAQTLNPESWEAQLAQAHLLLFKSTITRSQAEKKKLTEEAESCIRRALEINPRAQSKITS